MRMRLFAGVIVAALLVLVTPAGRSAVGPAPPAWVKFDSAAKLITLDIVAGSNANNGALNFNGYFAGDANVVVPAGWTVVIAFRNNDAMLPHSLLVTKPYAPGRFPDLVGASAVAIPRAYTNNPEEGIPAPKGDRVRFLATPAGDYYFVCGAPVHAKSGMWIRFTVDPATDAPYVAVASGADPGRP